MKAKIKILIIITLLQYFYSITCKYYHNKSQHNNNQNTRQQNTKYQINEQVYVRVIKIQQSYAILQLYKCSYGIGIIINITHYIDIIIVSTLYEEEINKYVKQNIQVSWEAIPGESTNVLKKLLEANLNVQKQYSENIYDVLFEQQNILNILGLQAKTVLGIAGWKQKTGWGYQSFIQTEYIPYFNSKYVKNIKQIELFTNLIGMVLHQQAVAYHLPKYKGRIAMKNGIQFNMNTDLTIQEFDTIYKMLYKSLGNQCTPPIFTEKGFKLLHFPSQKYEIQYILDPIQKQYYLLTLKNKNLQFLGSVINILSKSNKFIQKLTNERGTLRIKMFQSLGQLRQNNWNECDEDYRKRIFQNTNNSHDNYNKFLYYADCVLGDKIQQVNRKYSQMYQLGEPTSHCQKQFQEELCKMPKK